MSHPAIIKASALIHAGDISAAEAALTELVDTEGDNALVEVLDELAPKDLLAIIREYDSAKESVINLLVTPKQFADAVVMERLYAEKNRDRLRSMINSIIFRDDVDPDEFIEALSEKNMGLEVLADYLDDRFDELTTFKIYGSFLVPDEERIPKDEEDDAIREDQFEAPRGGIGLDEVMDKDWMELTWRLAHHFPDEFLHVFQILSGRTRNAGAPPLLKEESEGPEGAMDSGKGAAGQAPVDESAL
ncbi:MAG: hypothetical protein EXR28_03035 [Betaproteobacteria bacterium]|nr:hypothetical protein [Betaproteobacteria bacterium]